MQCDPGVGEGPELEAVIHFELCFFLPPWPLLLFQAALGIGAVSVLCTAVRENLSRPRAGCVKQGQ